MKKQYNNGRIKYRCKKCHCYATNKRIKHTSRCFKNTKKDPCYFYIFDKDEHGKMNKKQIENKKIEMDEKNDKEKLDKDKENEDEEELIEDEENKDEEENEKNEIIYQKIQPTDYTNILNENGS